MQLLATIAVAAFPVLLAAAPSPDAAFRAGDFAAARDGYAQRVRVEPSDAAALLGLATTELYANDLADARRDLDLVLRRDPSSTRARRLQRELDARSGRTGEFEIARSVEAVLPFVAQRPLPVVTMRIDGADARVAIDTGAPGLVVGADFARAHRLQVADAGEGIFAGGLHARIQTTRIGELSAGPLAIRNLPASVAPVPSGEPIDAVIGTAFFAHFLTTIDYPRHRLILRPAEAAAPANPIADVPMWLVGDHFVFAKAAVNDHIAGLFIIDSGAEFGVSLGKASLDAAAIVPGNDPLPFIGGGGETRVLPFRARSVALAGAQQTDVSGAYFPDGDPYAMFPFTVAGTVSGGFLEHYAVTFDFRSMRLLLTAST